MAEAMRVWQDWRRVVEVAVTQAENIQVSSVEVFVFIGVANVMAGQLLQKAIAAKSTSTASTSSQDLLWLRSFWTSSMRAAVTTIALKHCMVNGDDNWRALHQLLLRMSQCTTEAVTKREVEVLNLLDFRGFRHLVKSLGVA